MCQAGFCGLLPSGLIPQRSAATVGDGQGPREHYAAERGGMGTFLNWQDSTSLPQRACSLFLNKKHCGFTVQNCTCISFTRWYLISVPIANSIYRQALLVLQELITYCSKEFWHLHFKTLTNSKHLFYKTWKDCSSVSNYSSTVGIATECKITEHMRLKPDTRSSLLWSVVDEKYTSLKKKIIM